MEPAAAPADDGEGASEGDADARAGRAFHNSETRMAPATANGNGASGHTRYSTPGCSLSLKWSSSWPIARPTTAPARYCAPSKRPAAVATALRPPKSIDAAPPTIEWLDWMKKEMAASSA